MAPRKPGVGRLITASVGFQPLLRMLGSLFKYRTRDDQLLKRMRLLVIKLGEAGRMRNDVLHSFWVERPDLEEALVIRMESRPEGFREESLNYDSHVLHQTAKDFMQLQRDVQELHYAIYNSSASLRVQ